MFRKCKVIYTDSSLPERFKLNSEWVFSNWQGFYYIDGKYFTNNEFNDYFSLIPQFSNIK